MSARPPQVLLAGAFGQGNPGDESVLAGFVAALDGCRVLATCGPTASAAGGCTPVSSSDPLAVARAVAASDLVVATATVFKTLHPASGRRPLSLLANTAGLAGAARLLGRPVAFAGVGAGDLSTPGAGRLARLVAGQAAYLEARDEESRRELRRAGVGRPIQVGADVVWGVLPRPAPSPTSRPDLAVVAISHLAGGPELIESLGFTVDALADAGYRIALQPWQAGPDSRVAAAVTARAATPVEVWPAPRTVAEAAASLSSASLLVGLRFHSLVAAASAGIPFVAVAHEPKLAGVARRLGQVAVEPAVTGPDLVAAALGAMERGPADATAVERERVRAAATLDRVRRLAFARAADSRSRVSLRRVLRPDGTAAPLQSG